MNSRRFILPAMTVILALASIGCTGWAFPDVGADDPGNIGVAPPNPGGGGGVGGGGVGKIDPAPGGGGNDPADRMRPSIETPVPGQLNPIAASVWRMEPSVDGRHVTVLLSWWSGVAPCSVLDSVDVVRVGMTITMTPRDGADPAAGEQAVCPAIAMLRGTIVDLGELGPGTWTLIANGDLAPVTITVK